MCWEVRALGREMFIAARISKKIAGESERHGLCCKSLSVHQPMLRGFGFVAERRLNLARPFKGNNILDASSSQILGQDPGQPIGLQDNSRGLSAERDTPGSKRRSHSTLKGSQPEPGLAPLQGAIFY